VTPEFRLFPEAASSAAPRTDGLFFFLIALTVVFSGLIFILVVYFAVRFRRRSPVPPPPLPTHLGLEVVWTVIPLLISILIFVWGARVYLYVYHPPAGAMEIHVLGKQWMWKIQHQNGKREINELHLPLGRAVRLTLASQDVIHSFFLPEFRIKQDVLPGRYSVEWLQATRLGEYHLFCAEYCGTNHSRMVGRVVVMEPERYQAWLAGVPIEETPAQAGQKLFSTLGCALCHGVQAPTLAGLYQSQVKLQDGTTVGADEDYLRESILNAPARIVAGYAPIMPSFRGQISEEQLMDLIAYIKSLRDPAQLKRAD
jgi:cytochrome c oxidase subunit 2